VANFTSGFGGGVDAQRKGTAASVEAFKAREVDRIRPTFYDGKLDIKGPQKLIDQYKIDFEKRLKFPKGGTEYKKAIALGDILSDAALAKKYNITIGDVERINRVVKKDLGTYVVPDQKRYKTGQIRRDELKNVTDLGLEQEYTKLKKGERIGNPDLAHRVSKKYNVTTSNLGLDNPLINRVIVKPNERDISRLYDKRIKIENKYKLKNNTFKKPSNLDIKVLEKINTDVMDLASETKGRLSAIVNDPTNLNKPYGTFGVDHSKTIGGGVIDDVMLKNVRKLPLQDQAFLKLNLEELKKRELGKTPKILADEYKDILNKPEVKKRIEKIIKGGKMEKAYINQAKQLLNFSNIPELTTADQLPVPEKTKTMDMFKNAFKTVGKAKTAIPAAIIGGMMATGNEAEAAITYNPTIGSIVKTGSDDVASQSNLLEWAADNPEPLTVAGAVGAAGMTKPGSALLKGLIKTLAAPAGIATTAMTVKENMDQGESLPEALADPMAGLGMMGIGAGKLLRMGTPIGAAMTAAGLGKDYYEFAQDEIEKMNQMSDYDRGIYNDMLMDDTNIDF